MLKIVRATCHPSQPLPMQIYKNPDLLASIVVNNDKTVIRKEIIDKVDGDIFLQEVIYFSFNDSNIYFEMKVSFSA